MWVVPGQLLEKVEIMGRNVGLGERLSKCSLLVGY